MQNITASVKRKLFSIYCCGLLLSKAIRTRIRLSWQLGCKGTKRHFLQLSWGQCWQACRAILATARVDRIGEIVLERKRCRDLWTKISSLPPSNYKTTTQLGKSLKASAMRRTVELALGEDLNCIIENRTDLFERPEQSIRDWMLSWLRLAGADRGVATTQSLRNVFRFSCSDSFANAKEWNFSKEQIDKLVEHQMRLDKSFLELQKRFNHDAIWQEYVSQDLLLFAIPLAVEQSIEIGFGKEVA